MVGLKKYSGRCGKIVSGKAEVSVPKLHQLRAQPLSYSALKQIIRKIYVVSKISGAFVFKFFTLS